MALAFGPQTPTLQAPTAPQTMQVAVSKINLAHISGSQAAQRVRDAKIHGIDFVTYDPTDNSLLIKGGRLGHQGSEGPDREDRRGRSGAEIQAEECGRSHASQEAREADRGRRLSHGGSDGQLHRRPWHAAGSGETCQAYFEVGQALVPRGGISRGGKRGGLVVPRATSVLASAVSLRSELLRHRAGRLRFFDYPLGGVTRGGKRGRASHVGGRGPSPAACSFGRSLICPVWLPPTSESSPRPRRRRCRPAS